MANLFRSYAPYVDGKVAFQQVDKTATLDKPVTLTLTGVAKNLEHVTLDAPITLTLTATEDNNRHSGTLDKPVLLVSTAEADVTKPATLNKPVVLTSTASGHKEVDGTVDRPVTLTLTGVGSSPTLGQVDKPIVLTSTAQATVRWGRLNKPVLLTSTTATTQIASMHGAATMPAFTGTGVLDNPRPNDLVLPALTIECTVATGVTSEMEATLPMFTIDIDLGHDTNAILPALTLDASLEPGNYLNTGAVLPPLTIVSQLDSTVSIDGAFDLPAFISTARMEVSGEILTAADLPALQLESVTSSGNVANVSVTTPAFTAAGTLAEIATIDVAATLPSLLSNAQLHNGASAAYSPFVMNTESYTVAQYDNYNFHSVFERAGKYYGVNTAGIYELIGSDDNGTDIAASFKLGFSDLKKSGMKRIPYVYLGYTSDGDINIDVSIDGEPTVRQYTVGQISSTSGIKRGRAKIARGLKSRYWQFGVSNVLGADFEIEELGFYVQQFDRKAQ